MDEGVMSDKSSAVRVNINLDELIEGYTFKRKEEELFIFGNAGHELRLTLATVQASLRQKREGDRAKELMQRLRSYGIFRLSFDLNGHVLSLETKRYHISHFDEERRIVWLRSTDGSKRSAHLSMLQDVQATQLIRELKEIEQNFSELPLPLILQRIAWVVMGGAAFICRSILHWLRQAYAFLVKLVLKLDFQSAYSK